MPRYSRLLPIAIIALLVLACSPEFGCDGFTMPAESLLQVQAQVDDLQGVVDAQAAIIAEEKARAEALEEGEERDKALAAIAKAEKIATEAGGALTQAKDILATAKTTPEGNVDIVGSVIPFIPPPYGTIGALVWGALATARAGSNRKGQVAVIKAIEKAKSSSTDLAGMFKEPGILRSLDEMGEANRKLVRAVTSDKSILPI